MYNRPYFDHVYNHYDGQRNYPYPQPTSHYMNIDPEQQNFHQTIQQSFQSYYPQTPYDYFTKPQQPMSWPGIKSQASQPNFQQEMHNMHAPENSGQAQQPGEAGQQLDLDKMLSTVGQLANTYHQVSPIVKQFGSLIKAFR